MDNQSLYILKQKFTVEGQEGSSVAINILMLAGCKIEDKVIFLPPLYDNSRITLGDIIDAKNYLVYIEDYKWEWMGDLHLEKKNNEA
jgi:hypothetical protein